MVPAFYPEKAGHLGYPPADFLRRHSGVFQAEGKLRRHPVRDNLRVGRLKHEPNFQRGPPFFQLFYRASLIQDGSLPFAIGSDRRLQLAQKGGFAGTRRAAQKEKLSLLQGKGNLL